MSHNITASGNVAQHGVPTDEVPVTHDREGSWSQPVLTIADGGTRQHRREVSFLVRGGIEPGLVAFPWDNERYVPIVGEDLFALRELLNELPESAFKRPADPVESPASWEDGDTIVRTESGTTFTYVRVDGRWVRTVIREDPSSDSYVDDIRQHDVDMDRLLEGSSESYRAVRRGGVNL